MKNPLRYQWYSRPTRRGRQIGKYFPKVRKLAYIIKDFHFLRSA